MATWRSSERRLWHFTRVNRCPGTATSLSLLPKCAPLTVPQNRLSRAMVPQCAQRTTDLPQDMARHHTCDCAPEPAVRLHVQQRQRQDPTLLGYLRYLQECKLVFDCLEGLVATCADDSQRAPCPHPSVYDPALHHMLCCAAPRYRCPGLPAPARLDCAARVAKGKCDQRYPRVGCPLPGTCMLKHASSCGAPSPS
jgi:hypothetical protein